MNARIPFFVALMEVTSVALAQAPNPSQCQLARDATVDLVVTESPDFAALGLTPQEVTRPSSGRELATSLLSGVDRDGKRRGTINSFNPISPAPYRSLVVM